jgi:predicted LPLAT superfamily acyltransferase
VSDSGTAAPEPQGDWSSDSERGSWFWLQFVVWGIRTLGTGPLWLLIGPVAFYYCIFDPAARRASQDYLRRVDRARGGPGNANLWQTFRHLCVFADSIRDRLILWSGGGDRFEVALHGREHMERFVEERKGAFLLGAHLGSFDMLRVIAREADIPVNVVMYVDNAQRINDAFKALDPKSGVRVISLDPNSAHTAFEIRECIARGEFVAVLADRARPGGRNRVSRVRFLGEEAPFPQGPFLLPLMLGEPAILTVALKNGRRRYDVHLETISTGAPVPRRERAKALEEQVQRYATRLEHYCKQAPLQWYNFYDFWGADASG